MQDEVAASLSLDFPAPLRAPEVPRGLDWPAGERSRLADLSGGAEKESAGTPRSSRCIGQAHGELQHPQGIARIGDIIYVAGT
jgi:hypothetical protein